MPITNLVAQPAKQWDKTIGGLNYDEPRSIKQTPDGGYILGGFSPSSVGGDKSENSKGGNDYWIVKLDAAGSKEWDKTIGGNGDDYLTSLQQTADNGYMLGGWSRSNTSGDKSENSKGLADYWVVKLDAAGNKEWDKTIGGSNHDELTSLQQTADNGYMLGGWSYSAAGGDKSENSKGLADYWVVKLDAAGNKEWDKTIGGSNFDQLLSLQHTADNGYMLGGRSLSSISGDKTEDNKGSYDYWVVKLNAAGSKEWDKTIGGNDSDVLTSLQQTADGDYLLGGWSYSAATGDKTASSKGARDYWVVKLDAAGNMAWDRTIGGNNEDVLTFLQQTADHGFILGGWSPSNVSGDKSENSKGGNDYWIVKLDAAGSKEWDKTIGGNNEDYLQAVQQTSEGGYILVGRSMSPVSGDKSEDSKGAVDYWIVKLAPFPEAQQVKGFTLINAESEQPIRTLQDGESIDLADLPTTKLNIRADTYPDVVGGVLFELSGQQTRTHSDHQAPYALFGDNSGDYNQWTPEPGSYTLTATPYAQPDGQGTAGTPLTIHFTLVSKQVYFQVEWDKTLGGSEQDIFSAMISTPEGGYLLGGSSNSGISGDKSEAPRGICPPPGGCFSDYWVVKVDAQGNKQWDKTFGGGTISEVNEGYWGFDNLTALSLTADGAYLLGGTSNSYARGDKSEDRKGRLESTDIWILKIDVNGNKIWDKAFGGDSRTRRTRNLLASILATSDGGFLLGGSSSAEMGNDKSEGNRGGCNPTGACYLDYWIIKIDADGNKQWDKTFGGENDDFLHALVETPDGYLLGGSSDSDRSGDKSEDSRGDAYDFWVVKIDKSGNKVWNKIFGGDESDYLLAMVASPQGGFLLGGYSFSGMGGDKSEENKGIYDYWVVQIDENGRKQWDKTFGGEGRDRLSAIRQTSNGGYLLAGSSSSGVGQDKTEPTVGGCPDGSCPPDYWIVNIDGNGTKIWDKTLGGNKSDSLSALLATDQGSYLLGGTSDSDISGDKTEASKGETDYWVVKLAVKSPLFASYNYVGSAASSGACNAITTGEMWQRGAAWNTTQINLNNSFDFTFKTNQCGVWGETADGMVFVLQNIGLSALGEEGGSALGYYGSTFAQSVAVELDIYNYPGYGDQSASHIALVTNGNPTPLVYAEVLTPLFNCQARLLRIVWNSADKVVRVYLDGNLLIDHPIDILSVMGGNPNVYFGFTGATGGLVSTQSFCNENLIYNEAPPSLASYNYVGSAASSGACNSITTTTGFKQRGAAWNTRQINLNNNFDFTFRTNQCGIADGMMFVLQNNGLSALGGIRDQGSDLAYYASAPLFTQSLGIELDIFRSTSEEYADQSASHIALVTNGDPAPLLYAEVLTPLYNCQDRLLRIVWNSTDKVLRVYLDGNLLIDHPIDILSVMGGNPNVYFGFTGATGDQVSFQSFCNENLIYNEAPTVAMRLASLPEPAAAAKWKTYPNPFYHKTTVEFSVQQGEAYTLAVYDIRGSLVKTLQRGKAKAGSLIQASWEPAGLPPGIYIIRLTSQHGVRHMRVVRE